MQNFQRTKQPHNYIAPSKLDIREACERVGITTYSPQLVNDLSNIAAGGSVIMRLFSALEILHLYIL